MKTPDRKRLEEIMGQFMNEAIALHRISGAEIKILQNDEPLLEAVYGNKTLTEPLTPGCIYRIASMTKPITALAFLLACDEGLMAPEDELKTYLPAFDRMPVAKETPDGYEIVKTSETPILMWHLLSHVSGIGCDDLGNRLFFDEIPLSCKQSLTDVVNAIAQQPLAFEPMTKSAYSATASFDVLARVIEITSGRPFEAYIKERICDPLGMIHTSFFPSREEYKNMITLTDVDKDNNLIAGKTTPGCVFENLGYPSAGAGLASTADDYVKFASFLLHDGLTADGRQLLPADTLKLMKTARVPVSLMNDNETWGLGMRVIIGDRNRLPKGSYGWSGAYGTHFWVDPSNRIVAVFMRNGRNNGDGSEETNMMVQFEKAVMAAME